ncbi:hypothetical protein [Bradyrhizobium sp. CCBAU 53421]|uniref:hypothetical protein n=1 Tax=Bradyrhizobium sp. CCBAU 53421 TaxID=1325120 RepID=UPI00188A43DA|nr:hypothetical protein [Bradyrhizobium sp. CCBAU 53421]QOZ31809.1 hypothetical protein XH92_08930 [Bradyrhizobium sp. CCBAU 53421]
MSTIFDMLYHEYCRARLAEMRKQLLIPLVGEVLQTPPEDSDPSGPRDCGWPAKAPPTLG